MADIDKDSIMSLIGSLVGDDKKQDASNIIDALTGGTKTESTASTASAPKASSPVADGNLVDTAALMSQVTKVVGRLNNAKNNREVILLSAIKPYMRATRQPKIDSCLKILQAIDVIGGLRKG